jgi:hypothetical protein
MLLCGALLQLLAFALDDPEARHAEVDSATKRQGDSSQLRLIDLVTGAVVTATDSIVASILVAVLPQFGNAHALQVPLYFARPIVGVATAMLLPLLLRADAQRGRMLVAIGLVLLSCSCLLFVAASSLLVALLARCIGAVASAMITVPLFYTIVLQAQVPAETVGWRIGVAMFGAAAGSACGPWIGSILGQVCDLPAMMVVLAVLAAAVACMHLAVSGRVLAEPTSHFGNPLESGLKGNVVRSLAELLHNVKCCTLLAGVALSSAVLALHTTLLPFYLGDPRIGPDAPFAIDESLASVMLGLAILTTGVAADALGERGAICGVLVALVMNVLGLRSVVQGQGAGQTFVTSIGLCASQCGLGGYLGLALPMIFRSSCGCSVTPTMPEAAVASAAISVVWLAGDAFGVALQLVLSPLIGSAHTIVVFSVLLIALASIMFLVPGWLRAGQPSTVEKRSASPEGVVWHRLQSAAAAASVHCAAPRSHCCD